MSERTEAIRKWAQAEERLYPVVSVRPDLYEVSVRLVRSLTDYLKIVPDSDALVTSYGSTDTKSDFVAAGVDLPGIPTEVDLSLVRDAAYQMRMRELAGAESGTRTIRAIENAERTGATTATIWTTGENELWPPFRSAEMNMNTGFAVVRSVELSSETMTPVWVLEAFQLDPRTGEPTEERAVAPRREFSDPDTWRAATVELSTALLRSHEEDEDVSA